MRFWQAVCGAMPGFFLPVLERAKRKLPGSGRSCLSNRQEAASQWDLLHEPVAVAECRAQGEAEPAAERLRTPMLLALHPGTV